MMKKKILLAVCAVTAATAMAVGFTACGDDDKGGMSAEDAAKKIAGFTSSPTVVDATFKQTYKLTVNDERESFKAFEKDIADTVTVNIDYTAGNVYYYGKKVAKDNSVTEQLVVKEESTYYFLTTTTAKTALADEAAAKAKIGELLTSLSKQTSGYVDGDAFTYNADWVNTYLLLGSKTISGTEKSYFTYNYDTAANDGLKVSIDMKYVGYYGDAGTFEFGTDATHTGAKADIETDSNGFITSFNQTLNNHLDMNITNPAIPLDLAGTRSLTAAYGGTLTKKAASDIDQVLTPATAVVPTVEHATITTYDFNQNPASLQTPTTTISVGNILAVKVVPDEGYTVSSVTVNGAATEIKYGYYCLMTPAEAGATLNISVVVVGEGEEAPSTVVNVNSVDGATVNLKGLQFNTMTYRDGSVEPGEFICIQVIPEDTTKDYLVSVTLDGKAFTDMSARWDGEGMLFCYMDFTAEGNGAAVENGVYDVTVVMKEKVTVTVNEAEGVTINLKGLFFTTMTYRDGAVADGEFICVQVILDSDHTGYNVSVTIDGAALTDMSANWSGEGKLFCYMPIVGGRPAAATAGTTYNVVVTLTAAN